MTRANSPSLATLLLGLAAAAMAGCSSVSLPSIDLMGESDFSEEVNNLDQTFPSADETPDIPTDVRNAGQWDRSAKEMLALQEDFNVPPMEPALSDAEFNREFARAQAATEAYKEDDPQ